MPKRMVDDSLLNSPSMAVLSPRAQDAFVRFILLADDFGCFEVSPRQLAAKGWPDREKDVTEADVDAWLTEYATRRAPGEPPMAMLWTERARRWCFLTGWFGSHGQRRRIEYDPKTVAGERGSKRRTPSPPAELLAAVMAGEARLSDGLPPGSPVADELSRANPGGNGREVDSMNPNKITPARETHEYHPGNDDPPRIPAAAVPAAVAVPVPAAAGREAAAAAKAEPLPSKVDLLAREYPVTQELLDALAIRGWILTAPAADKRKSFEAALKGCIDQALAFILDDLEDRTNRQQEIPGSLGWYLGDASALAKRGATPEPTAPPLPVLDTAWIDLLPEPRRTEARAAWEAKQVELEAMGVDPTAAPRWLASGAELLRQQFTEAAP